ncbi:ABC transporter permease [Nocardioides sp. zg-579]|uniref:Transport permease protein n=1 Tax=Nocardioides marmotae TaxID=2663857 RepID=A0A6I3JCE4_9ACTN|nr:ABC transporter permease [Nocardioides marmotae]MCR6032084.1 ABC transporter permease [Gordonia jinghuaiqii]MTB95729.1 ABC transporter permease [Nocardioides marmotae]QKE01129.1 ABC transporter permease [Nocardioides marmotae]
MTTTTRAEPTPREPTRDAVPSLDASVIAAVGGAERPPHAGPVSASLTYGWRALLKIKHVPEQLFDVTMFPIMFTLMFTYVFGGAMAGSPGEYLQYALPGILTQTVIFITMYTAMTINTDIEKGVFDRFRSLPVWRPALLVGALLGDALRYVLASAVVLTVGVAIGYRAPGGFLGVVAAVALLVLFCVSLTWLWLIVGLKVRTPNAVMGISMMVLFPLTFVSSVFAPPETMPGWLQSFVDVNPVTLLVEAARGLMNDAADGGDILLVVVLSVAITAVFAPIALRLYNRKT